MRDTSNNIPSGLFVTFEGGEGAGKSTQIRLLADTLRADGREVVVTRAPGGTLLGESIRNILLHTSTEEGPIPRAETLLFLADIAHTTETLIAPAIERGAVVLCDRFFESTVAYQGCARGLGMADVSGIAEWAVGGLTPDVVVFLDADPRVAFARKAGQLDRMEATGMEFHDAVRQGFLDRASNLGRGAVVIDAGQPIPEVHAGVLAAIAAATSAPLSA